MKAIPPSSVRYAFAPLGMQVDASGRQPTRDDRLYLDVGNRLQPGTIDHHHLAACSSSTTRLVLENPELLAGAVRRPRKARDPFTIALHEHPDLDCLASAYLAVTYLTTGAFPQGAAALASYVDEIDAGYLGHSQDNPYSLYSAYMLLADRLSRRKWSDRDDMWRKLVVEGLDVLAFVMERVVQEGAAILEVDAFACPGHFGPRDRDEIRVDLDRYVEKLAEPKCSARILRLRLPRHIGGTAEVDALFIRDVQNDTDPDRVKFFKDWARTDRVHSPSKKGFVALSVYHSTSAAGTRRAILSVTPESRVCLRGLGALLDEAEAAERIGRYGCDDRVEDPQSHQPKERREGYDNADPWYDGRAHMYTIIDSPRQGTLLSAETIDKVFLQFGRRGESEVQSLSLLSRGELSESLRVSERDRLFLAAREPGQSPGGFESNPENVKRMTTLAESYRQEKGRALAARPLDVFISYPQVRRQWVIENVYEPLKEWRTAERVFLDMEAIQVGAGWLATLAEAVDECRVFLPVYCPEFFRSEFCQWELQLAVKRDPIGAKRIVVPMMIEHVPLPQYCSLIQHTDATEMNVKERIVDILASVLEN